MASSAVMVRMDDHDRLTLACALMSGTPGQWSMPPVELLDRLLGEKLATAVLEFRFPPDVLRMVAEAATRGERDGGDV